MRTQIFHEASANKQIFAKQGYQKFVREDALSLNVSTRNERAYNASPIKIRKRISSGRALSVRIIKNKKTGMKPVFLFLVTRSRVEACTLSRPEFFVKTPESVAFWHFFLAF